jgi:hypothetical protein
VRRRFYILLVFGLTGLVVFLVLHRSEPVYQGRTLSDWVVAMHRGKAPERERARVAVHHLGSNSIPVLLRWLRQPDRPSLRARLSQAKAGTIRWLEGHKLLNPRPWSFEMDWKGSYSSLAINAFSELGPEAKAAVPELIQLLGDRAGTTNEPSDRAGLAYVVLRKLAPACIPGLIEALSSPDSQVWCLAAGVLADIGPQAKAAIPALRPRLADRDPLMRVEAADALGKLGSDPGEFMPVVVATLREPDLESLDEKLQVLLRYKDHAQAAVPLLRELLAKLQDAGGAANRDARYMLTNALGQLDLTAPPVQQTR